MIVSGMRFVCLRVSPRTQCTDNGSTALYAAAQEEHYDVAKTLIRFGADIYKVCVCVCVRACVHACIWHPPTRGNLRR
jgi:hypothetical protein